MLRFLARAATLFTLAASAFACASAGTDSGTTSSTGAGGTSGNGGSGGTTSTGGTGGTGGTMGTGGSGGTGGSTHTVAPSGCVTEVSAGHHAFDCAGIHYDVEVPDACAMGGCGVVLDIPGYTSNGDEEDLGTNMRALGQQHGYVIVQPTPPGLPATWVQSVDNPKLMSFVTDVTTAFAIDPKRVHVMGFSQGGALAWGLICAHADTLASAASLAAASPWVANYQGCDLVAPAVPSQVIPVLQVHGHNDLVVNFSAYALTQLDAAQKLWGWSDDSGVIFKTGDGYEATRFTGASGVVYELWEHDYMAANTLGGHCFPGGAPVGVLWNNYGCSPPNGFVYGEVAMQFFRDHPKD